MSALGGIVRFDAPLHSSQLSRLSEALAPFGPDRRSQWLNGRAGLVHTLQRSTLEDLFDRQPLVAGDGSLSLVFAGRIDNRDELANLLGIAPADANHQSDSALVLRAFGTWGEACLGRLVGDFAFAAWEPRAERLFLARDPLGNEPLYWHKGSKTFAFASAAAALHALPEVPRELDEEYLAEHLALLFTTGERSPYVQIQRLMPGHCLVLEGGHVRTTRYHTWGEDPGVEFSRTDDYVEAFRDLFETAVRCRLRAVGGVGSHLSSGYDSSIVTAVAARQLEAQGRKLTAFTAVPRVGFDAPAPTGYHLNEGFAAASLANRHSNLEHILVCGADSLLDGMESGALHWGRPVLTPANDTWMRAIDDEAAHRGIRVLLTGLYGNIGLSNSGTALLPSLLARGRLRHWVREAKALRHEAAMPWKGVLGLSLAPLLPSLAASALNKARGRRDGLSAFSSINPEFARDMRIRERAANAGRELVSRPPSSVRAIQLSLLSRRDLGDINLGVRARSGVHWRHPAGDRRLLQFCLAIPEELYLRDGKTRWILHQAFGELLPREITQTRTKGYQGADWFEKMDREIGRLSEEFERIASSSTARRVLDIETLRQALAEWPNVDKNSGDVVWRYRLKVLRGLAVGSFIQHVERGNR